VLRVAAFAFIIIITIIIIIIRVITFMQCIYNYIPGRNHVSRVYSVAAVLYLQFVLYVMLFHTFFLIPRIRAFCYVIQVLSD